jgi:hypothetical protein
MYHFKTENSNTYFIHKITRNETTMMRYKKIKNSVISKLYNLNTLNVLGLIYSMKCEVNVTYPSVLDQHCEQRVCMSSNVRIYCCHRTLPHGGSFIHSLVFSLRGRVGRNQSPVM